MGSLEFAPNLSFRATSLKFLVLKRKNFLATLKWGNIGLILKLRLGALEWHAASQGCHQGCRSLRLACSGKKPKEKTKRKKPNNLLWQYCFQWPKATIGEPMSSQGCRHALRVMLTPWVNLPWKNGTKKANKKTKRKNQTKKTRCLSTELNMWPQATDGNPASSQDCSLWPQAT